ncbi:MAG: LLM class flavin-dependent oxidoreductase [Rhodococcus sp. (in: high G+C Gram-positive bacteria)]|uniref:LLM class flavin-dependent oxidoreductase n=1 Tax=Rhodococcus TaxID=1827 RepID=UPI001E29FCBF|nr:MULTISPECIES: LLM class flavin-dependent oxidoreductase [Rhodococcus erythropolis group]MCD2107265.1 LLM class flavin-dependent oxidoreductase [Rhodococcus qingshengii]MCZ4526695.1 LLM class flavin-dependent oxidoreductase [Rhodococcus erythropolis]MDZ7917028.1 LLM class flavin-dependent oxidoreductase [Rhodococcus sp. (in: high G+C Gram-positive bacteria)]
MSAARIAVVVRPEQSPEDLVRHARYADEAGIEEVWLWEDCFFGGGIATAAAVLAATERLGVAIGVLPTPMRNTAITAMEVSALARVHPDRLRVGFGHGVQSWMRQIGAKADSPLTLLREQFGAVERLLRGESVTVSGRYVNLTDVELAWPPEKVPQLLVGATGPKTLALSGELAQGTVLSGGTTPDGVRRAIAHIGAQDHEVVVYVICAFGSGGRERALAEASASGSESPEEAIAAGTAAEVAVAAQRWTDAGATTVVLQPTVDEPDVREFIRLVAQEVQPLVL